MELFHLWQGAGNERPAAFLDKGFVLPADRVENASVAGSEAHLQGAFPRAQYDVRQHSRRQFPLPEEIAPHHFHSRFKRNPLLAHSLSPHFGQ